MKHKTKVTWLGEHIINTNTKFRNKETKEEYLYVDKSKANFQRTPLIILKNILTKEIIEIEENKVERID